jgi:hypothetical protein
MAKGFDGLFEVFIHITTAVTGGHAVKEVA